jgi:hypothetical protein
MPAEEAYVGKLYEETDGSIEICVGVQLVSRRMENQEIAAEKMWWLKHKKM